VSLAARRVSFKTLSISVTRYRTPLIPLGVVCTGTIVPFAFTACWEED
jgi:hypothetical protein